MRWHPDPVDAARWRLSENGAWTSWVSDGAHTWFDPRVPRRPLSAEDAAALAFVVEVFLPEARGSGVLDPQREGALRKVMGTLHAEASIARAVGAGRAPAPPGAPQDAGPRCSPRCPSR